MMGISIDEPSFVFGENQYVLADTSLPNSTLRKKSLSIASRFYHEGVANNEWLKTYLNTNINPSDMLTN